MNENESTEPAKPRPRVVAKSIMDLRAEVKAKDKFAIAGKPEADAIAILQDTYHADLDSAKAFVTWIKGGGTPDAKPALPAGSVLETWHRQGNLDAGTEDLLTDQQSEKARASRSPGKGKKKS
ncbi:hypothetical protein HY251_05110 [bacterium]|nr:hypothetical protein [bacterium]